MRIPARSVAALAILSLMVAAPAAAHELWVEWQAPHLVVSRGSAPDERQAYDATRVADVVAFDSAGRRLNATRIEAADRVLFAVDGTPTLASVQSAWGPRVQTTMGKRMMSREQAGAEGLTVLRSFSSTHHAKSAFGQSPLLWQPTGLRFEFVLTGEAGRIDAPGEIGMQLLFDGAPLAGKDIHYARAGTTVRTDADGKARIRLEGTGLHVFQAMHEIDAAADPDLDVERHMTFMTFLL